MRRVLALLCAVTFALPAALYAQDGGGKGSDDELLRRSEDALGSYPGGPAAKAPLSTGYYAADNDAPTIGAPWAPSFQFLDTTGSEIQAWRRILSGPRQRTADYWKRPESEGLGYFRNPNNMNDSTNDAFAGPIAIGFPYYYYGRKYDSFYVSTNGLIALSNRRYQYDELGNRTDYEPVSDNPAARTGNVATDVADDYGYRVVALNSSTATTAGILNPNNGQFPQSTLKSVIAPLWDDMELSQYNPTTNIPDDFGKAYYRRDRGNSKLIIYWANMSMVGTKTTPLGTITAPTRGLRANIQVVLDRTDSTIYFNYRFPTTDQANNASVWVIHRMNSTIGIQSHDQEFTNYLTNNSIKVNGDPASTPHPGLAIKFKQWRNIVRVQRVTFQVPSRFTAGAFIDLPATQLVNNYELLLGHPYLGVIRPVGVVQNTSSDIGPVNIVPQPVRFNVIFRIRDLVNVNSQPPYQRTAVTNSLYPIFGSNATRPSDETIIFDPYYTNQNVIRQAGRFRAEVISTDRGPNGENYNQEWNFDDTTGVRLFGIRRLEAPFFSTFDNYDVSEGEGEIPPVFEWVTIGAQVRNGEETTYNPPPPRGQVGNRLASPVVQFDRKEHGGNYYFNNAGGRLSGDTLISFPINISSMLTRPVVVFSYQRSGKQSAGYPRGWSDQVRVGPEHATYNTAKTAFLTGVPDALLLEFAEPSYNGIDGIVNIPDWRDNAFRDVTQPILWAGTSPRWGVFGGGGYSDTLGRIITNEFDAGKDFEFNRAYIPVPARWWKNVTGNKYFRFRLRMEAKMDGSLDLPPSDDGDDIFVDNIMILEPDKPEIEVTSVRVDWPYTQAPASQARAIPISAKIGNNGGTTANSFGMAMYVENLRNNTPGLYNYYRYRSIISIGAGADLVERFPEWNAQECGANITPTSPQQVTTNQYRIWARILPENNDSYPQNDIQYTDFSLTLGPSFAYDDGSNDVPSFANDLTGKGLNLVPPAQDPTSSQPFGPTGGTLSGTFAMQFRILTRDTILGYQAFYASANQAPDEVLYSIYQVPAGNSPNDPPANGGQIARSRVYGRRGEGVTATPTGKQFNFNQFVTYMLDTPVVVEPGYYFVTVAQLGETGLELGGDGSRQGQVTTIRVDAPPGQEGTGNYSIPAHPEMQRNIFWFETSTESGRWTPMLSLTNNPGFPHLDWRGTRPGAQTNTRASWIPMIRPYFGAKESQQCLVEPVELSSFEVTPLSNALRLDWKTATETNNHGFYIERRVKGGEEKWNDIAFQQGAGNSNQVRQYNHVDNSVAVNTTYQYRLRQEDRDGSVNYSTIKEGRIDNVTTGASNNLSQNTPNPFSSSTRIAFNVAASQTVQLEINDVYGNVIRTFSVDANAGGENEVMWDGRDQSGALSPNGVYVYKLVGDGFTLSNKLTIAR